MEPTRDEGRSLGRLAFLGVVGTGLLGLVWGKQAVGAASQALTPFRNALPPQLGLSKGWRIYTIGPTMPRFDPAAWRLEIAGHVERPVSLSYDDLLALPQASQVSDFHCVTGWSVEDVRWRGVRFADLLAEVRPKPGATALRFVSAEEPYDDTLLIEQALLPDVMFAHQMDDLPLTRPHGAPFRVVMPQMYGYKSVKWVRRIEVVTEVPVGYWEQRGYDTDAWVGRSNGNGA